MISSGALWRLRVCHFVYVRVCVKGSSIFSVIMFAKNNRESVWFNANGLCVGVCVCAHVLYQKDLSPS